MADSCIFLMHNQGWIQDFGMGAQVELRGREYIEAPRASRRRRGSRVWGASVLTFWLKIVHFGIYSDKNSQFIRPIAG